MASVADSKIINGYRVVHFDDGSYEAYDDNNNIVYTVACNSETNDLTLETKTKNGMKLYMNFDDEHPFSPYDIKPNGEVIGANGDKVVFSDGLVIKKSYESQNKYFERIYNDDIKIQYEYDKKGGEILYESGYDKKGNVIYTKDCSDNTIRYYIDDDMYCIEYEDGSKVYLDGEDESITIHSDGIYSTPEGTGTYIIDRNGNIVCTDKDNNKIYYNKLGKKCKLIKEDGTVYNYDTDAIILTKNNRTKYSRINHIEYDEEAYDAILKLLNEVKDRSFKGVNKSFASIENAINKFPDSFLITSTNNTKNNIIMHINLIEYLQKMTNYSLLAYQTCDESLREGLELLVDSLFGDKEPTLATSFKGMIYHTIYERDGILEYKEGTNFKVLSNNAIAAKTYVDKDGNKWYLSKNNTVVGMEGTNFKIEYGDESFTVTCDEDGVIKLIDSNGKALDIFGEYNLDSIQYGSNQMNVEKSYYNPYITEMISKYFPSATMEEKEALLSKITYSGCGYAAMTNLIFKEFEGKENDFYKTFGYPMYGLKKADYSDDIVVDYNYEAMITNIFCEANSKSGRYSISETTKNATGINREQALYISNYLKDYKGVTLGNAIGETRIFGDRGCALYYLDGKLKQVVGDEGHIMIITGYTEDGKTIVSSWGEQYIYEKSSDEEYINDFNAIWKEVLNHD